MSEIINRSWQRDKARISELIVEKNELRAKLQAAVDRCAAVELGFLNAISRAEAAEARIVELETAVLNWYEWSTNDSNNDAPLDTINEIALLMLDQEPKVTP